MESKRFFIYGVPISILMGLVFASLPAYAAVPVDVVAISGQDAATFLQGLVDQVVDALSAGQAGIDARFVFDLFTTLKYREEDFTKSFELQKIEKAREDVSKLIFHTQRELVDNGIVTEFTDPVTQSIYTIRKPGRIIHNLDDFLYEEPIQKGRDFIYCYFGGDLNTPPGGTPWKIFPLGDTEAKSIALQKQIRDELLSRIQRKAKYKITAPPETWYTQDLCDRILASFPVTSDCFESGISDQCPSKAAINYSPTLKKSISEIKNNRGYFTIGEMTETATNPNNTFWGVHDYVSKQVEAIIGQYAGLRYAEYIAGQGIQPERTYVLQTDTSSGNLYWWDTDYIISPAIILLQKMQAATQAQFDLAQNAYLNLDSLNFDDPTNQSILSAYNLSAINPSDDILKIQNEDGSFEADLKPWLRPATTLGFRSLVDVDTYPILGGLPAPWEDQYKYQNIFAGTPPGSLNGYSGYNPTDFLQPNPPIDDATRTALEEARIPIYGEKFSLNVGQRPNYRWFKDVLELYDYASTFPNDPNQPFAAPEGWQKLLAKWFMRPADFAYPAMIQVP